MRQYFAKHDGREIIHDGGYKANNSPKKFFIRQYSMPGHYEVYTSSYGFSTENDVDERLVCQWRVRKTNR